MGSISASPGSLVRHDPDNELASQRDTVAEMFYELTGSAQLGEQLAAALFNLIEDGDD